MTCPACSSARLSPATRLEGVPFLVHFDHPGGGLFSWTGKFTPSRAKICRDCGYLLQFLDAAALTTLNAEWDRMKPAPE